MTTTETPATFNRVSGFYERPQPTLPDHPHDRQALLADCVMQAVLTMRNLLNSGDKSMAYKAAETIIALEQTRIRHGGNVIGCRAKMIPKWEDQLEMKEAFDDPGPPREPTPEEIEEAALRIHAEEVQAELQKMEEHKPVKDRIKITLNAGRQFVRGRLKLWSVSAASIPAGTFWKEWIRRDLRKGKPLDDEPQTCATP